MGTVLESAELLGRDPDSLGLSILFIASVDMRHLKSFSFILAAGLGFGSFSACLKKPLSPPLRASLSQTQRNYPEETKEHVVRKGETLALISERYYGSSKGWKALAVENKLREPNRLPVGLRLRIPPRLQLPRDELKPKVGSTKALKASPAGDGKSLKTGKRTVTKSSSTKTSSKSKATIQKKNDSANNNSRTNDSWNVEEEAKPLAKQSAETESKSPEIGPDLNTQQSKTQNTNSLARFYTCIGEQCSAQD